MTDSVQNAVDFMQKVQRVGEEVRKRQSPPGALGLPAMLDARRLEYGIPDGAFSVAPVFDRLLVYQLSQDDKETFGDTLILKSEVTAEREKNEAPRGIIVGAGLEAMDSLLANGMNVGQLVVFIKNAPWRLTVDNVMGHKFYVLIMRVGDIIGSEDAATALRQGTAHVECKEVAHEDGVVEREHHYVDEDGKTWNPTTPFIGDDY